MKFGSRCKTIFSLFQAGFVNRYGNRTGSVYAETEIITVGVKFDLLICICTHMKSVNCCHHIYNKNMCLVVFENVKCVALPGLGPSYEQSTVTCQINANSIDFNIFSRLREKISCLSWSTYFHNFGVI